MTSARFWVWSLAVFCGLWCVSHGAVIGIDFGSEYIKIASVKPGTPFHIVLDEQAKRKVPAVVAFDQDERLFGNHAVALMGRKPKDVFAYIHRLLGKKFTSPEVKQFKQFGYPYDFVEMPERGGAVGIKYKDRVYAPEEMVAMILEYVKKIAIDDAEGQPVKDCVITVPVFFSQTERQAMLDAAAIAGLNVLSLINENSAAAIQYGIDRKYNENETHTAVFYNMGSSSTEVTLARYSAYSKADGKKDKTVGQFEVEAVAWDEQLGGESFDMRLVDLMIAHFDKLQEKKGGKVDLRTNDRAMAKMRSAANRAKTVLSANQDTGISIEGLLPDVDFKMKITRDQLYEACSDLIARSAATLKSVLQQANLKASEVDVFIPIGGNTRIPGIQAAIKTSLGRDDLNAVLNGDEAMAMGAVFRAANLSTAFQVRKFGMVDQTPYPVGVRIQDIPSASAAGATTATPAENEEEKASETEDADGDDKPKGKGPFSKRASLFRRENRLSKRKTVTLTHDKDFVVSMHHDSPKLLPKGLSAGIAIYNVTGLNALMINPDYATLVATQTPRVSLSFSLDGSGMVSLAKAEATLDEMVKVKVPKVKAKVNATASANADNSTTSETPKEESSDDTPAADSSDASASASSSEEKTADDKDDAAAPAAGTDASKTTAATEDEYTTKKVSRHVNLDIDVGGYPGSVSPMTLEQIKTGRDLLKKFMEADNAKKEIAAAKNAVESFIYGTRSKIEDEEVEAVSTEAQRDAVRDAMTEAEEWLSSQAEDDAKKFKKKIEELRKVWDPIAFRMSEINERPQAINASNQLVAYTREMLTKYAVEKPWIPLEERESLLNMTNDVESWLNARLEEQDKLAAHDTPAFSSAELIEKLRPIAKLSTQMSKRKKPKEKEKPIPKVKRNATTLNGTDDIELDVDLDDIKLNETSSESADQDQQQQQKQESEESPKDEL